MGKDLGTYHLRVEFADGRGYIQKWETCARYFDERSGLFKLDATPIAAHFESEEEIFQSMRFMYEDGNYACDCNRLDFLARAYDLAKDDNDCGHTLELTKLTAIRPDRSEIVIFEEGSE